MLGRNHTDVAKQHFRQSMAKRLKEKPDTVQSWRSYKGWYKGLFFRSSYECFFMKQLEAEGLSLRDDVQQETFHIPYTVEGVVHTYIPDFYVPSRQAVYEVKSKHMSDDAVVRAKTDAAISFLASRGISYTMVTGDMLSLPKQRDIRRTLSSDPCVFLLNKLGEGDTLELLFSEQRRFMELLQTERGFPMFPVDLATKPGQKLVKDISHDCMHELFEAVHLLRNSKSHRKTDVSEFDREAFLEELADVLHYLIEVMIVAGISPKEIYEAYMKKGTRNFARLLGGY